MNNDLVGLMASLIPTPRCHFLQVWANRDIGASVLALLCTAGAKVAAAGALQQSANLKESCGMRRKIIVDAACSLQLIAHLTPCDAGSMLL
jgi:hypothetical protein